MGVQQGAPTDGRHATTAWFEELKQQYLCGEASVFVLHGNVYDRLSRGDGERQLLLDCLVAMLGKKKNIYTFTPSVGVQCVQSSFEDRVSLAALAKRKGADALHAIEQRLWAHDDIAVVIDYAETIFPAASANMLLEQDRASIVMAHRWSLAERLQQHDSVVILITECLSDLNEKLLGNPRVSAIRVPLPDEDARRTIIRAVDPRMDDANQYRLALLTAGLKAVQIESILAPRQEEGGDLDERRAFIASLLTGPESEVAQRAAKFATMTQGMSRDEIRELIEPEGGAAVRTSGPECDPYAEVVRLVHRRKREIIEKECFGLVQFVEAEHGFDAVGGMQSIKAQLADVAENIRMGRHNRVPMGILFVGPMGTGKTFLAEAFARESGLTAIKFKNFRSKWVGSTEANLEKILGVVQAMGNVLVVIDEGDRAFGNTGDSDGGTSSRVIARIKEFMSDTSNRGRILFILMTNRPDKLDIDIKRAGRLDRKIPFFYASTPEEIRAVLLASMRKNGVRFDEACLTDDGVVQTLMGYSNADLEAVALLANEEAFANGSAGVAGPSHFASAVHKYLGSRDAKMLEFMELLAVFEASSRAFLPAKYATMSVEDLQARLDQLREELYRRSRMLV